MRLNILADNFIGDIARTDGKIAARPQMTTPITPFQFAKFLQQFSTTATLEPLHQLRSKFIGTAPLWTSMCELITPNPVLL
jgi:hypothetical protein